MFTWNFQYVSKARLIETLSPLMLNEQKGDVLVRIHTAIHLEEEAVDIARTIKQIIPRAMIFGTSTSAVLCWGKLMPNQCVISVTTMKHGSVKAVLQSTYDSDTGKPMSPDEICMNIKSALINSDTKLLLTFVTLKYPDAFRLVERCNEYFPHIPMAGGVAGVPDMNQLKYIDSGFVFNEKGWSSKGIIAAAVSGREVECFSSFATGIQDISEDMEITGTFGNSILTIDGKDAAEEYKMGLTGDIGKHQELLTLFPFVYSDNSDIPIFFKLDENTSIGKRYPESNILNEELYAASPDIDRNTKRSLITAAYNVETGKKIRRAFIYDRKIIADNRALFRRVENFEKAETIFAYTCVTRSEIYSNCTKWEISAYENSNMCGCLTYGEIVYVNGRNVLSNCTFTITAAGEEKTVQQYNPYALTRTDSLAADNHDLIRRLMDIEQRFELMDESASADRLKKFVKDCELKLLYSEREEIPGTAALNMDINLHGYDRICIINVFDTASMDAVFPEQLVKLTHRSYLSKCVSYAKQRHYNVYHISDWMVAIAAPSYMLRLSVFVKNMQALQRQLFEASNDHIAIVPMFCVLDGCTAESLEASYNSARIEMMKRNIQFYIHDSRSEQVNVERLRERSHMVNVINYAVSHDKVIPYYQGIRDNKTGTIHHYESLMRLEDENGRIYPPGSFLDTARTFGLLYDEISYTMVRKVFDKFENIEDISVSINLGIRDISNDILFEYICGRLASMPHPENFVFEILENEDIEDYDRIMSFVATIQSLGGKISIDDFGSGYSNLRHIANIHCDYLKIDGSIIKNCCTDEQSENLTRLIALWKKISSNKFSLIAEFVENSDIQEMMLRYDIDFSQGYLFSKPAPELMTRVKTSEV